MQRRDDGDANGDGAVIHIPTYLVQLSEEHDGAWHMRYVEMEAYSAADVLVQCRLAYPNAKVCDIRPYGSRMPRENVA